MSVGMTIALLLTLNAFDSSLMTMLIVISTVIVCVLCVLFSLALSSALATLCLPLV